MATRLTAIQIISQISSELDRLLESDFELATDLSESPATPTRIDIVRTDEKVCLLVEVPGVPAEHLEVTVVGSRVTVTGDKIAPGRIADGRFLCVERQWGRFERSVELPAIVNPRKGTAVLDHGILRMDFPVMTDQRNQPFRLPIETADGGQLE